MWCGRRWHQLSKRRRQLWSALSAGSSLIVKLVRVPMARHAPAILVRVFVCCVFLLTCRYTGPEPSFLILCCRGAPVGSV